MSRTSSSPIFFEPLRRDTSIGTLSRDNSLDSAVYQSPQEEAAYFDRPVDVGRPRMNKHKVKYSRKMHRKQRVDLGSVEVPEEFQDYVKQRKDAEMALRTVKQHAEDTKKQSLYRRFETVRMNFLQNSREHIVREIELLRRFDTTAHPITVSPTPLDPSVQQRFVNTSEGGMNFDVTFHGTNRANYDSIFHKGLCVPFTHGVTVQHGSAHGVGIYSSSSASYSRGYSNVTALLVCAHCSGTGKSVGNVRVSFDASHVTPIAVVSWGEESAESITQYGNWQSQWKKHSNDSNSEYDHDDCSYAIEINLYFEGLRNFLQERQRDLRWMKRVDRRKKGKEYSKNRPRGCEKSCDE